MNYFELRLDCEQALSYLLSTVFLESEATTVRQIARKILARGRSEPGIRERLLVTKIMSVEFKSCDITKCCRYFLYGSEILWMYKSVTV